MSAPFGLAPRGLLGLVRTAREDAQPPGPIAVTGVRARELAEALARDGDRSLVRETSDPEGAAALVVCVEGAATTSNEDAMRRATRAGAPVIAIQLGDPTTPLPYVLAGDVVAAHPGAPFAAPEIARALATALGADAVGLAAGLPVLREPVARRRARDGALTAAALAGLRRGNGPMLPVLTLAQARLLRQLAIGRGAPTPSAPADIATSIGPELGAALATGIACRAVARRLPRRGRLTDGLIALAGTAVLAAAAERFRPV